MIDWSSLGTQEFLSFDSDLDLAEARRLTGQVDPEYIVIRRAAPIGEYFVVPTADLDDDDDLDHDGTLAARTIGDLIDDRFMRAIVIDTDDGWIHADPPTDTGALYDAVVLGDDGIVSGVVPAFEVTISPPPGESAASDVATGIPGVPMLFDWRHLRAIPKKFPGIVVGPSLVLPSPVDAAGHRALGIDTITTPTERSGFGFAGGDGGPGDGGGSGGGGGGGGGDSDGGGDGREDGGDGQPDGGVPMALDVQFPDTVQLGATASVLVLLTLGQGGPGSAPISAVDGEVLEIMVSPTVGFTLASAPSQPMTVRVVDETLPVRFELTADVLGKGVAKVYAFRGGGCVASLTVSANIIATPVVAAATPPAILTVPAATGTRADLDLTVFKESYRGGTALRYRLSDARQNVVSEFGPVGLDTDPSGFVHSDFAEIQRLNRRGATWGTAEQTRLGRIGAELYELLVPSDLQEVLWGTTRVRSLLVQTEEPWIPWELCRMTRKDQSGRISSRGFLCELFDMSRWLPGIAMKPNLTASRIGVIAPTDSALPSRRDEVAMIDGLGAHGPDVEQIPATYSSVVAALEGHRYDVIHFIGHGQNVLPDNASRSEIVLSGRWRLTPSDISGETRNLGMASPVVFMNACEVAQASMALHGIGGWASVLTRAGAGAVIGTHWDVRDDLAHRFSTAFYDAVVGGSTIAAATRSARDVIRARADCDATWLAYSVHAAPDATCSFAAPDR